MDKKPFIQDILKNKKHIFSQTIEDGVIETVFKNIGTTNKYFVEFGSWDGLHLSNTANLRINEGWTGLLMEGNKERADMYDYVTHAFITAENINELYQKHQVPAQYDLLSIDIDGNDYWIWKAIDETKFNARVVIIEYNCNFEDQRRLLAKKYEPELDSTIPSIYYYSATIAALKKLGESKGYSLIFRVNLHNLVFVKTELLHEDDINIPIEMFINRNGKSKSYKLDIPNSDSIIYYDTYLPPHWNIYADTALSIYWEQNYDKEWIEV